MQVRVYIYIVYTPMTGGQPLPVMLRYLIMENIVEKQTVVQCTTACHLSTVLLGGDLTARPETQR